MRPTLASESQSPKGTARTLGVGASLFSGGIAILLTLAATYREQKTWMLEYFPNDRLAGQPVRELREQADFFDTRNALLPGLPDRESFSLRMRSCLPIVEHGLYRIHVKANDGVRLLINGSAAIDTWGRNSLKDGEKLVPLPAGVHALTIEYVNHHGPASLAISMSDAAQRTLRPLNGRTILPRDDGQCAPR